MLVSYRALAYRPSKLVIHVLDAVLLPPDDEPTKGPTAMEESDSAGRAGLAVAAAAAVAYVL